MRQGKRLRNGILAGVGAVALLLVGQGAALAIDASASLDDPIGTITDALEDPVDTITDALEDPIDTVTDAVDDPIGTVTDRVDETTGTIDEALGETVDPILGGSGLDSGAESDPPDGAGDGGSTTNDQEAGSSASTAAQEVSSGRRAAMKGPGDLDELAEGGNDVVTSQADPVCVGTARDVCVDLVGGLGVVGILFRAAEEARDVVSAFVDSLAKTGIDLLTHGVTIVALTLLGIVLISRRPRSRPGSEGSPARA
jgi:hypothetical protein